MIVSKLKEQNKKNLNQNGKITKGYWRYRALRTYFSDVGWLAGWLVGWQTP